MVWKPFSCLKDAVQGNRKDVLSGIYWQSKVEVAVLFVFGQTSVKSKLKYWVLQMGPSEVSLSKSDKSFSATAKPGEQVSLHMWLAGILNNSAHQFCERMWN